MRTGIDFKSFMTIKGKYTLKNPEDVPLFETENDFVRVNNYVVVVSIAPLFMLKFLWHNVSWTEVQSEVYQSPVF